jgi:hypothetical protein
LLAPRRDTPRPRRTRMFAPVLNTNLLAVFVFFAEAKHQKP